MIPRLRRNPATNTVSFLYMEITDRVFEQMMQDAGTVDRDLILDRVDAILNDFPWINLDAPGSADQITRSLLRNKWRNDIAHALGDAHQRAFEAGFAFAQQLVEEAYRRATDDAPRQSQPMFEPLRSVDQELEALIADVPVGYRINRVPVPSFHAMVDVYHRLLRLKFEEEIRPRPLTEDPNALGHAAHVIDALEGLFPDRIQTEIQAMRVVREANRYATPTNG